MKRRTARIKSIIIAVLSNTNPPRPKLFAMLVSDCWKPVDARC